MTHLLSITDQAATTEDKLVLTFKTLTSYLTDEIVTKRIVLSSIAKIFDPFGILSLVLVAFKVLRVEC